MRVYKFILHVYECLCLFQSVCVCVSVYVYMCVSKCMCLYMCVCECVCVCVCEWNTVGGGGGGIPLWNGRDEKGIYPLIYKIFRILLDAQLHTNIYTAPPPKLAT